MLTQELLDEMENKLIEYRNKLSPETINFRMKKKALHEICIIINSLDIIVSSIIKLKKMPE